MGSFKSENSGGGGFLARAEAARGSDTGSVRDQFSRLEVGQNSFQKSYSGTEQMQMGAATQVAAGGERDWMNFASN